jgi:hypothetical protein
MFQSENATSKVSCRLPAHIHPLRYTPSVQNIRNTFLILGLHPILPSEQTQFIGAWTLQGVQSISQGCWPMLTPMLPAVVSSWLDVLWMVDHSWYTQETVDCENPEALQFLTHKLVRLAPTTRPCSKALKYLLSCPFTLWMSHTHNPCLNCLKA